MDRSVSMALSAFRARLQAFINDPNVNTLGFKVYFEVSDVACSKISKAFLSRVGRALAQASMAPFIIRMFGRSMLSNISKASSVFPLRPKLTIFRSRSALERVPEEEDDILVAIERDDGVNGVL